ncbi:uncharacterized protein LOC110101886 isoform X4 [Dendrobium catenatum]|uniref:uncharacterized protein LOC110101886 isoform X4 n=1 Tax=Dendrobium catenatum TaxID=906689 RepID=UPI0009F6DBE6|nr:uncharacterized protein LOC110101886 isoform X4 [Dendrobium catenatum]
MLEEQMATDMHESKQHQPSSDSENNTDKEDDVKVCDICGDVGQEDSLAICSRCLDGAEHIYCMETMLDELPDGDWICEECKFKEEYKNQETVTETQEQSYLDGNAQHGSTIYKKDGNVINEDMVDSRTLQIPEISFMRRGENVYLNSATSEKASKRNPVSAETSIPPDISLLSPEGSLTNQVSALKKPSHPEQSSGSCPIIKRQKAQTSVDPISSASRDGFKVISGPLLKSSSFKNTNTKPKVKQLLEAIPLAVNTDGKFPSKNTRKGGLTRGMVKSTSFKTEKGTCNDFELINEKQSVKLNQFRNSSVERTKELGVTERENSSALDFYQVVDRGLIDGDDSGYKRDPLHSSSSSITASSNGLNLQYHKPGQTPKEGFQHHVTMANNSHNPETVSQCNNNHHLSLESTHQDDIANVAAFSTTSTKPISGGSRNCQKCNETGETIIPKQEALQCTNTTDQSKEFPIARFGHGAKLANKEFPLHCFRRTYQEGRTNVRSSSVFEKNEPTAHPYVANRTEIPHDDGASRLNPFGVISKEFHVKPSKQVLPSIDPCCSNTLRTSVIPQLELFWQGGFEVLRAGRLVECCDGLQAHFSSYASGKVLEAAKKFPPYKVQLEEVPCISSWPQNFHGNHAKEQNIALFFFAKDIESYRSNYCKLLGKMLKFDLALKGNLGGFELLIFPSNKLSENSQRWNRLLFLWGTFKGRRSSSPEVLPNVNQDPCKSTIDVNLPTTVPETSCYQETNSSQNSYEEDKYVVAKPLSTGIENRICHAPKYFCHTSVDAKLLSGNPCPPPVVYLPDTTSQIPTLHDSSSESSCGEETDSVANGDGNHVQALIVAVLMMLSKDNIKKMVSQAPVNRFCLELIMNN